MICKARLLQTNNFPVKNRRYTWSLKVDIIDWYYRINIYIAVRTYLLVLQISSDSPCLSHLNAKIIPVK